MGIVGTARLMVARMDEWSAWSRRSGVPMPNGIGPVLEATERLRRALPDPDLYVAEIPDQTRDAVRHCVVLLQPVNEGAAFEYIDPLTGDVVGCVGRNNRDKYVVPLDKWVQTL